VVEREGFVTAKANLMHSYNKNICANVLAQCTKHRILTMPIKPKLNTWTKNWESLFKNPQYTIPKTRVTGKGRKVKEREGGMKNPGQSSTRPPLT
jgi:hypothetical protein